MTGKKITFRLWKTLLVLRGAALALTPLMLPVGSPTAAARQGQEPLGAPRVTELLWLWAQWGPCALLGSPAWVQQGWECWRGSGAAAAPPSAGSALSLILGSLGEV